jgi:hypothetical protein
VSPEVEQAFHDVLDRLFALEFDKRDGEQVPHVINMSHETMALFVDFYN